MGKITTWFKGLSLVGKGLTVFTSLFMLSAVGSTLGSPATPSPRTTLTQPSTTVQEQKSTLEEKEPVEFKTDTSDDEALAKGQNKMTQEGVLGERTIKYEVIRRGDQEISKKEISNVVTKTPIDKKVSIGTYIAPTATPKKVELRSELFWCLCSYRKRRRLYGREWQRTSLCFWSCLCDWYRYL